MPPEKPRTSEEMLDEARRSFDEQPAPVVEDPESIPTEAHLPPAPSPPSTDVVAEPQEVEPAAPMAYPSDVIESPHTEPNPVTLPPGMEDLEEPEPGVVTRLWARRGIAVALIVGGVFIYSTFFDDSKPVDALSPGECFDSPDVGTVYDITTISCDEPHDFEVFATVTVPTDGAYPPDATLLPMAWEECYDHFESYVGVPFAASVLYIHTMVPTEEGWDDGDRGVTCLLFEVDASEDLVKSTGSLDQARV